MVNRLKLSSLVVFLVFTMVSCQKVDEKSLAGTVWEQRGSNHVTLTFEENIAKMVVDDYYQSTSIYSCENVWKACKVLKTGFGC